jgi:hypothetical protein
VDWVKLSARYYLDPVIASLPDADSEVMFTRSLAYAGDQETGGFIPAGMLPALCRRRRYEACADALVASGLWLPVGGGFSITRWQEWQLELEAIARRRSADRDRKRRERGRDNGMSRDMSEDTEAPGSPDDLAYVKRDIDEKQPQKPQVRGMSRDTSAECPPPREERVRTATSKDVAGDVRADIERLCQHLADRIEANGSKRPAVTGRWHDAARLMIDRDKRTEQQVHTAIDWCQDHEFWRGNILSMPKLREKYDQLRLQARRPAAGKSGGKTEILQRSMERAKARENANEANGNGAAHHLHQRGLPAAGDQ